ncbi:MAG: dihydrodipicolinate synthase family protein [Rhodospirillales bacterium]|jgi:4-hydroxy-tetrahydrodipicolinate synthase|nr:dihydrodipicolinate synthase family protein [Rhodospirillales bacterium]MDP6805736.1 dihydrodipicolinate synthase family protein [Rhodospirillales bacterium]
MDRHSVDWEGPCVALVTPFDSEGRIDEAAFRRNVELCLGNGVAGLLVSGCTGEFWALSKDERKRLYRICVDAAHARVPVIGGAGAIRTEDAIELADAALEAGCAGAMILPPFFVKPSADDIVAHYQAVADAVRIPILLYNIPSAAVNALTPPLVDRLADIETVVAIKESSFDFNNFYKTIELAGDRIRVFGQGYPGLLVGASGSFHVHANYWDERSWEGYRAFRRGDHARARALQAQSTAIEATFTENGRNYYVSVKTAMNLFGRPGGYPRLPLRPLDEPHLSEMRSKLEERGLVDVAPSGTVVQAAVAE